METAKRICVDPETAGMDDTRKYFRKRRLGTLFWKRFRNRLAWLFHVGF